ESSLENYGKFSQADIALDFVHQAIQIQSNLEQATDLLNENKFNDALSFVNQAEDTLKNYNGNAVSQLIDTLSSTKNTIKTEEINLKLQQDPDIDELKSLVWEAEAIKTEEASEITSSIRSQIIDYIHSKASESLNEKQFSNALAIVEDGLKYATDSD